MEKIFALTITSHPHRSTEKASSSSPVVLRIQAASQAEAANQVKEIAYQMFDAGCEVQVEHGNIDFKFTMKCRHAMIRFQLMQQNID